MTATAVKERPILFSGPMIRAILEGRKTQTRRVMKPQPAPHPKYPHLIEWGEAGWSDNIRSLHPMPGHSLSTRCPYGVVGDRLWVREGFIRHASIPQLVGYVADGCEATEQWERRSPSIHMPRRFSRITLEVAAVRVERLQEISHLDRMAEGMKIQGSEHMVPGPATEVGFRMLWDSINAKRGYGWDANPWVWAVSFRQVAS